MVSCQSAPTPGLCWPVLATAPRNKFARLAVVISAERRVRGGRGGGVHAGRCAAALAGQRMGMAGLRPAFSPRPSRERALPKATSAEKPLAPHYVGGKTCRCCASRVDASARRTAVRSSSKSYGFPTISSASVDPTHSANASLFVVVRREYASSRSPTAARCTVKRVALLSAISAVRSRVSGLHTRPGMRCVVQPDGGAKCVHRC
jgi:hypothetical protein